MGQTGRMVVNCEIESRRKLAFTVAVLINHSARIVSAVTFGLHDVQTQILKVCSFVIVNETPDFVTSCFYSVLG